jgi:hypothetical protein
MKCKDCECHDFVESTGHSGDKDTRSRGHYCHAYITVKYPSGGMGTHSVNGLGSKYMTYKEFISVPEWCPLNKKFINTREGKFPIIRVEGHA